MEGSREEPREPGLAKEGQGTGEREALPHQMNWTFLPSGDPWKRVRVYLVATSFSGQSQVRG